MSILCTFPGKYGDLLWALPTVRAIARRADAPVDLVIAAPYSSIAQLVSAQPYIGRCIPAEDWVTWEAAPIAPRVPPSLPSGYDRVVHLGYREWPVPDVARHTLLTALLAGEAIEEKELALGEPWITTPTEPRGRHIRVYDNSVVVGFSDEWVELKLGVLAALYSKVHQGRPWRLLVHFPPGSRQMAWKKVFEHHCYGGWQPTEGWERPAQWLQDAQAFVGCCSALHVLAVACGVPVVLMEPNTARHHPSFYPLGTDGRVLLVRGGDGLPTFDARHVADALGAALKARSADAL